VEEKKKEINFAVIVGTSFMSHSYRNIIYDVLKENFIDEIPTIDLT
jgi:hypothetical protein